MKWRDLLDIFRTRTGWLMFGYVVTVVTACIWPMSVLHNHFEWPWYIGFPVGMAWGLCVCRVFYSETATVIMTTACHAVDAPGAFREGWRQARQPDGEIVTDSDEALAGYLAGRRAAHQLGRRPS